MWAVFMRLFSVDPIGFFVGGERVKIAKVAARNVIRVKFASRPAEAAVSKK